LTISWDGPGAIDSDAELTRRLDGRVNINVGPMIAGPGGAERARLVGTVLPARAVSRI
jgi:hypothetical protein